MFVPLYDVNALKHIKLQYVTLSLIAINTIVWLITGLAATDEFSGRASMGLGYIPALLFDDRFLDPSLYMIPKDWTYITYAFLHGDFWHLAGNMLFLWVFGDNVEDAMGHVKFLVFYLLCAVAAAWFHGFLDPHSTGPLIGASGAVELVATVLSIRHGLAPPVGGLEHVDPEVSADIVVGEPRLLSGGPAVSNSFAFGGHNVSLVVG